MKLVEIQVRGVGGIADGTYAFAGDITAINGPAASGKTALLRAILGAYEALAGRGNLAGLLAKGAKSGEIRAHWAFTPEEVKAGGLQSGKCSYGVALPFGGVSGDGLGPVKALFQNPDSQPEVGGVDYFGAHRQLLMALALDPVSLDSGIRRGDANLRYGGFENSVLEAWIARLGNASGGEQATPSFDELAKLVSSLDPGLKLHSAASKDGQVTVLFGSTPDALRELKVLSSSEQQAFLFAYAFWRYRIQNSVILIDEPELHRLSGDLKGWLKGLTRLGSNNQFILASGLKEVRELSQAPILLVGPQLPAPQEASAPTSLENAPQAAARQEAAPPSAAAVWRNGQLVEQPSPFSSSAYSSSPYSAPYSGASSMASSNLGEPSRPASSVAPPSPVQSPAAAQYYAAAPAVAVPAPATAPQLTLQQFAYLAVELERPGIDRLQCLSQNGYAESTWGQENERWRGLLTQDGAAYSEYSRLIHYYRALSGRA